jgi:hypothetical protein
VHGCIHEAWVGYASTLGVPGGALGLVLHGKQSAKVMNEHAPPTYTHGPWCFPCASIALSAGAGSMSRGHSGGSLDSDFYDPCASPSADDNSWFMEPGQVIAESPIGACTLMCLWVMSMFRCDDVRGRPCFAPVVQNGILGLRLRCGQREGYVRMSVGDLYDLPWMSFGCRRTLYLFPEPCWLTRAAAWYVMAAEGPTYKKDYYIDKFKMSASRAPEVCAPPPQHSQEVYCLRSVVEASPDVA